MPAAGILTNVGDGGRFRKDTLRCDGCALRLLAYWPLNVAECWRSRLRGAPDFAGFAGRFECAHASGSVGLACGCFSAKLVGAIEGSCAGPEEKLLEPSPIPLCRLMQRMQCREFGWPLPCLLPSSSSCSTSSHTCMPLVAMVGRGAEMVPAKERLVVAFTEEESESTASSLGSSVAATAAVALSGIDSLESLEMGWLPWATSGEGLARRMLDASIGCHIGPLYSGS
mmetsp:Transcript_6273/g.16665  ORF Transcript_6273/g.16665 Transcript_6273/m.16665 type:complete len:227 (-) Transcript_6273:2850-3530(-)